MTSLYPESVQLFSVYKELINSYTVILKKNGGAEHCSFN